MSSSSSSPPTTGADASPPPEPVAFASVEELRAVVDTGGENLVVIDVRNPDFIAEPGDEKSLALSPLPDPALGIRVKARHHVWDRTTNSMPLPDDVPKDAPIITHCGAGKRGQMAKDYLVANGYTNVWNGAGPKEKDLWAVYGDK